MACDCPGQRPDPPLTGASSAVPQPSYQMRDLTTRCRKAPALRAVAGKFTIAETEVAARNPPRNWPILCSRFRGLVIFRGAHRRAMNARCPPVTPTLPAVVKGLGMTMVTRVVAPSQPIPIDESCPTQRMQTSNCGLPWLRGKSGRSRSTCSFVNQ